MTTPLESFDLGTTGWKTTEGVVIDVGGAVSDEPGLFRLRTGLKPIVSHPDLSHCLAIVWRYAFEHVPPSADSEERMRQFQHATQKALENDLSGVLSHTCQHGGSVTFYFYVSNSRLLEQRINEAVRELPRPPASPGSPRPPRLPISLGRRPDPEWSEYEAAWGSTRDQG